MYFPMYSSGLHSEKLPLIINCVFILTIRQSNFPFNLVKPNGVCYLINDVKN